MGTTLSERLRSGTKDMHHAAERAGIMKAVLRGKLTREAYTALLRDLLEVYTALEQRIGELRGDPVLGAFDFAPLARVASIQSDLLALHGAEWQQDLEPSGAARVYAARAAAATAHDILAHAYVRYLGDLSGGQILRKVIGRQLVTTNDEGLSFYVFDAIPDADAYKNAFRESLDALPLSDGEVEAIVNEAVQGFRMNVEVFEAVADQFPVPVE